MEKLVIEGGRPLKGDVKISGSKNAALPILAATLLTQDTCVIRNVPKLRDTMTMLRLLRSLGKIVEFHKNEVIISQRGKLSPVADYKLVSTMRGSFCVMGPLLARLRQAQVSLPGGCVIGVRPVDLHLKGFQALGAKLRIDGGYVYATAKQLRGASIYLGGLFGSSVLATGNVMMAATLAKGLTVIESAACEPEVTDLGNFLVAMGAKVTGQGTPQVTVHGVKHLHGAEYTIESDRIEAGTFMLAAAATHGDVTIHGTNFNELFVLIDQLEKCGVKITRGKNTLRVKCLKKKMQPASVTTYPYPGFPTDLQAQFMALMAVTPGLSVITEKVFPDRFIHIAELNRMGASIRREGNIAIIEGVKTLHGAPVMASDLRASAALVIAGLAAAGRTEIHRVYHLERGYENMDAKLSKLGAKIYREKE